MNENQINKEKERFEVTMLKNRISDLENKVNSLKIGYKEIMQLLKKRK